MRRPTVPLLAITLCSILGAQTKAAEPYTRVSEQLDGNITLEMCDRAFVPDNGIGPRVHLVSAIHIADEGFYQRMQDKLDAFQVVLFEGVKPAGLDPIDPELSDQEKAAATRDRLHLLTSIADQYHSDHAALPEGFDDLHNAGDPRIRAIVDSIQSDAWGNPIIYQRTSEIERGIEKTSIAFLSYGADHKPGGEGVNKDLRDQTEPYRSDEKRKKTDEGIQTQLANALHVAFQLDEMDTTKENYINADMDINELNEALAEHGEESAMMLQMLEGESFSAKVAGFMLRFVARSPQLSSMMKLMLMDMLALSEETDLLAQHSALDQVIVKGRNEVVIEHLKQQLDANPAPSEIAIFYGAGHMPGLEDSLIEMGYKPAGDRWTQAMRVDPSDTGLSEGQVRMMRNMIKNSLEQQLGIDKRKADED